MIRKPIAWHWHVVLGLTAFLTLVVLYTLYSWHNDALAAATDGENIRAPGWERLYKDGLLRSITPDKYTGKIMLWEDFKATYFRLFLGLAISVAAALIVGILMGCYAPVEAYFLPPMAFFSKIPGTAMLVIFFAVFGIGLEFYVAMIVFGLFPTLVQSVYHAAKEDVPEELLFKARTLGASQLECIYDVIYKHILPRFLEAIRLAIGPAMIFLLAAEYANGGEGFGCRLRLEQKKDMSLPYFYILVLGTTGLFLDTSLRWLQRKLCPWFG
jgi:NitT/TauT family transport system permease protein